MMWPSIQASVVLTEFLARADEPWVELHNSGSNSVELVDYRIRVVSNDPNGDWRLENLMLLPNTMVLPVNETIKIKRRQSHLALIHPSGNNNSKRYTGPFTIDHITVVRAMASKASYEKTNLDTHTYVFRNDLLHQPDQSLNEHKLTLANLI